MRLRILIFLTLAPVLAQADSRDARERQEVLKIFDLLTSKMDVTAGDGIGSDLDCVFSREWDESWHRNAKGVETKPFRPRELLSLQEALDPLGQHAEMFCDYAERVEQAQILAQSSGKNIAVANVGFSYPVFGRNFETATVYYQQRSDLFYPDSNKKRGVPVGSNGIITARKRGGVWTYESSVTGISN
ncbi:hypothetical protein [Methylosinus sp. RM1]|uniref:hypothetical protein n=1 Tax=Methylosinus sp. RM1 TaxID=2583817 RepID=UPI001408CB25|nr:hypothetical protein [Methylosinus sp. RM1]